MLQFVGSLNKLVNGLWIGDISNFTVASNDLELVIDTLEAELQTKISLIPVEQIEELCKMHKLSYVVYTGVKTTSWLDWIHK